MHGRRNGHALSSDLFILRLWIRNVNHYAIIWGVLCTYRSHFAGPSFSKFCDDAPRRTQMMQGVISNDRLRAKASRQLKLTTVYEHIFHASTA